jgi:hypothetical protein
MLLIIAAPDVRDHLSNREVSTVLFLPASIGSMVGELPRAHDISGQWISITIQEYSKSSLMLTSAKRFSSSTNHRFAYFCGYIIVSQLDLTLALWQDLLIVIIPN